MFQTQWNYKEKPEHLAKVEDSGLVQPNQSYTVKELLERFTYGTLPGISKQIYYDPNADNEEIPVMHMQNIDLVDIENMERDIRKRSDEKQKIIKDLRTKLNK